MAEQGIPLIGPLLNKLIGSRNERFVKRYTQRVNAINAEEPKIRALTDTQIRGKLKEFRGRIDQGVKADALVVESFAVAREAMDRAVGIRNIFNPKFNFDPSVFSAAIKDLYVKTKAEMDARAVVVPRTAQPPANAAPGTFVPDEQDMYLGCHEPVPGWQQGDIPLEIYEAVRALYPESKPPFRARPFDVQLIGGMVLTGGKIAEMRTGEGKTIVAPLACYLACVEHLKIHVVTVNDYLVQRDRDWTFPFFWALGLTVGAIHPQHIQDENQKRLMYRCDVVYGTTAEFGFDYLRDNMKRSVEQQVQKRRQFAVVDEVDSILIDEARTPLIISGPAHEDQPRYDLADRLARDLVEKQRPWTEAEDRVQKQKMRIKGLEGDIRQAREKEKVPQLQAELDQAKKDLPALEAEKSKHTQYYEVQLDRKQCHLVHDGVTEAQRVAGIGSFYVDQNMDLPHLLEQSLRAYAVYQKDRDYVIMNVPDPNTGRPTPSIVIVDVFTGRPMIGRQWSDGLHQAVECKEKVPIKQETQTVATVTIQNFFKMYKRLAGMTGTADTEAQEFHDIYKLDVVSIPTNKPVTRRDFDDLVFLVQKDKWGAIVDEIKAFHDAGRPILVGTTSVEKSESLSQMLTGKYGIKHEVLNAKQHEREAHIVENAGQLGQVMIATNMAGRGTDIKLGAISREAMLEHWLRRGVVPRTITVNSTEEELREAAYRKLGPQELDLNKREVETMPFAELEVKLLRHWAMKHTWVSPKKIESMDPDELRKELDAGGRFLLHRLHWFTTIEEMGGLHVIGTERHEARRIDNQLRGRSGRQGDRGSSRFFVSLEDDLMKLFAGETTMKFLARMGMKEGDAIEHPMLSKSVERAQRKVEERNFQIRKNVLEYDEVMEHQRQRFYGLRQRVLEGRDVKGLLFEYIKDAVDDAAGEYLDPDYPAQCAAEFARQKMDVSVDPSKLKSRDIEEMITAIHKEAKHDVRSMIDLTLGEYMPAEGSEVNVDFDAAGLIGWARSRFGVEVSPDDLRQGSAAERQHVRDMLVRAADAKIDEADLSGLATFTAENYGAEQLAKWVKNKFLIDVTVEEILAAKGDEETTVSGLILGKASALYHKREVEYPVDYAMEMTMMVMRHSPADAAAQLATWGNRKFNLGWTPDTVKSTPPQKIRQTLLEGSEKFVNDQVIEKAIAEAQTKATDADLDAWLREKYGVGMTENMKYLEGEERRDAIRSRIENLLRQELLHFERTIMLETLDQCWKDHLYAMDQLRDSINFRAYSQQDPRIEYKREGSRMFSGMLNNVRDQVTDYIFKARVSVAPQMPAPRPGPGPTPQAGQPAPAGSMLPGAPLRNIPGAQRQVVRAPQGPSNANIMGSSISGPGFDPPAPPSA